jgi:8-amino-7-oxononanoate synthase
VDFVVGTFSKSLGAFGGFCASNVDGFEVLRVACRPYMFTASLPPSVIASVSQALTIIEQRPELRSQLRANAQAFHAALKEFGFEVGPQASPIIAVGLPDITAAMGFWSGLLKAGIYVNLALPPATPTHRPLLRCSITAAHTREQIEAAVQVFVRVGQATGLVPTERPAAPAAVAR